LLPLGLYQRLSTTRMNRKPIIGLELIPNNLVTDDRGWVCRLYDAAGRFNLGLGNVDHSLFVFNQNALTLRGMHYQINGFEESKITICVSGRIFDAIIDLRPQSITYLQTYVGYFGPQEENIGLAIPAGCAHGYLTLTDHTSVVYFMDQVHSVENERGILWDDPQFAIPWPIAPQILSLRDANHPKFSK